MAATQALYLKGSTLWRKNPVTLIFERVAQMRLVPVPTATQEYADSTNHDSEGAFEENEPTIKRGDESGATLVFHPDIAMHNQIYDDFINQTKLIWRSFFPDGVRGFEFTARVSRYGFGGGGLSFTDIAQLEYSLKVTGLPTRLT
jgi:hypothetical protein